jgi:hypothetical protein
MLTKNTDYQNKCKKMFDLILAKQDILFKKREFISIADYIKFFEERYKYNLFPFPSMYPYNPDILNKYSDKIYNSSYMPLDASGNLLFNTIIQFSKDFHGLFVFGHLDEEADKVAVYATLYSINQENFLEFIKSNDDLVLEDVKPVGFMFAKNKL